MGVWGTLCGGVLVFFFFSERVAYGVWDGLVGAESDIGNVRVCVCVCVCVCARVCICICACGRRRECASGCARAI